MRSEASGKPGSGSVRAATDLTAAALGFTSPSFPLATRDIHFVDACGRAILLHGVNVSASSKLPASFSPEGVPSFVGRPFPLRHAPYHLARLREWGFTTIRLLVTWEALQPVSPHEQDEDFIQYLHALLSILPEYGIRAFICAHQDVWSRATGGDGAPAWTLELVGLNVEAFHGVGAAYVHGKVVQEQQSGSFDPREKVGPFVWPSGYQKLAAATMATVFWAGDIFAHKVQVPSNWRPGDKFDQALPDSETQLVGLQTFLQDAFLRAFGALADAVGGLEGVLGFEVMNEPHRGFINLHSFEEWDYTTDLHIGFFPSFLQAVALGEGHAQLVPFYVKSFPFPTTLSHYSLIEPPASNPPLWKTDGPTKGQCLWRMHDVWAWDAGRIQHEFGLWERIAHLRVNLRGHANVKTALKGKPVPLRSKYFDHDPRPAPPGTSERRNIEWYRDCYAPLLVRFTERTRERHPHLLAFYEPLPNEFVPPWLSAEASSDEVNVTIAQGAKSQEYSHSSSRELIDTARPVGCIFAPHFYDLHVLFNKASGPMSVNVQGLSRGMFFAQALYFGARGSYQNYSVQVANLLDKAYQSLGRVPALIGEVGIPYDINDNFAFRTGNYQVQSKLLDALMFAMEGRWASYTLWNYCPDNTTEHGDMWNAEDFSLMTLSDSAQDLENKRGLGGDRLYEHGRCLDAVIRPYAVKIAGLPISTSFNRQTLEFQLKWETSEKWPLKMSPTAGDGDVDRTRLTEVFWPRYQYEGRKVTVEVSDGDWWIDEESQSLYVLHSRGSTQHSLRATVHGQGRSAESDASALAVLGSLVVVAFFGFLLAHKTL